MNIYMCFFNKLSPGCICEINFTFTIMNKNYKIMLIIIYIRKISNFLEPGFLTVSYLSYFLLIHTHFPHKDSQFSAFTGLIFYTTRYTFSGLISFIYFKWCNLMSRDVRRAWVCLKYMYLFLNFMVLCGVCVRACGCCGWFCIILYIYKRNI